MSIESSLRSCCRTVVLVLALVCAATLAACGSSIDESTNDQPEGSPTESTDSSPAQMSTADGNRDSSTTVPLETSIDESTLSVTTSSTSTTGTETTQVTPSVAPGAARFLAEGFSEFSGKRIGLIASRASVLDGRSVIDLLAEADDVNLVAIFTPEHGLRADGGAGELIDDEIDPVTGLPVFSLYGATRQPTPEMLADIDVLLFDLQDVGARYYTYTATMGLAMQAAADAGVPFVVLDRPNPLGGQMIDGGVRTDDQASFVSQYPVPSLHGLTTGELALAIKGEAWLDGLGQLDLRVMELTRWSRALRWPDTDLAWLPPSPGLPTVDAALVYPATVLFETAALSYGRGTDYPFQQIGAPWLDGDALATTLNAKDLPGVRFEPVSFVPTTDPPNGPAATDPQFEDTEVFGVRLVVVDHAALRPTALGVHLFAEVLAQADAANPPVEVIERGQFFDLLAGTATLRRGLLAGETPESIIDGWAVDLESFDAVRSQYFLY